MAGIRDWIRSRSKSRSRGSQDIRTERQAEQQDEVKNLPPLALLRADSTYNKKPAEPSPPAPPRDSYIPSDGYTPSGTGQVQDGPYQPLSPSGGYESLPAGQAPQRGTYPLHGNGDSRPQSQRAISKSPSRASRTLSVGSNRRFSRQSGSIRSSLPPGTAVTADEPIAAASPPRSTSSASRQPVSNLVNDMYRNQPAQPQGSARGTAAAPAVPSIPGQYRPSSSTANYTDTSPSASYGRDRVVSDSSRISTSSRTPIAEEFASDSWYSRNQSPPPSASTPVRDMNASHPLRHQPDVTNLNNEVSAQRQDLPPRDSSLQRESPSRGRIPRRSLEKSLPVPKELQSAPWNRESENVAPNVEPLRFDGRANQQSSNNMMTSQDQEVKNLADQIQPLSIQDRGQSSRNAVSETQQSATIRDFSEVPEIPGGFPEPSPETKYPTPGATPYFETTQNRELNPFVQGEVKSGRSGIPDKALAVKNAAQPISLKNVVDISNTEDTSVHTRQAPVVTHETVHSHVHNIRHEEITREIHTHDVYHRELPIIDVQVLPARHFVPTNWIREDSEYHPKNRSTNTASVNGDMNNGDLNAQAIAEANEASGFTEVPAHVLPNRTVDKYTNKHWIIAETASKLPSQTAGGALPEPQWRRFTAKAFPGKEGDYEEWVDQDGIKRSGQTWVHQPTHDMYLKNKGMTQPLYMDECDGSCGGRCGAPVHQNVGAAVIG